MPVNPVIAQQTGLVKIRVAGDGLLNNKPLGEGLKYTDRKFQWELVFGQRGYGDS